MTEVSTIGFDLAKRVFQVHGIDGDGAVAIRRQLRRSEVVKFFAKLSPCVVGMEACASAHYWARTLAKLGHDVRLISPAQVKPYVKRGRKNDAADAAAIAEAVTLWRRRKEQGTWLAALLARKTARQVSVALANKMARIAWAILAKGSIYKQPAAQAA